MFASIISSCLKLKLVLSIKNCHPAYDACHKWEGGAIFIGKLYSTKALPVVVFTQEF